MSPSTQVSLIALVLFFAVAGVSSVWPRLAGLERSRMGPASGGMVDRMKALTRALRESETKNWDQLSPRFRTRILYLGAAVLLISVISVAVQLYYATPPQLVQRTPQ
jgi:hypothetical protein